MEVTGCTPVSELEKEGGQGCRNSPRYHLSMAGAAGVSLEETACSACCPGPGRRVALLPSTPRPSPGAGRDKGREEGPAREPSPGPACGGRDPRESLRDSLTSPGHPGKGELQAKVRPTAAPHGPSPTRGEVSQLGSPRRPRVPAKVTQSQHNQSLRAGGG